MMSDPLNIPVAGWFEALIVKIFGKRKTYLFVSDGLDYNIRAVMAKWGRKFYILSQETVEKKPGITGVDGEVLAIDEMETINDSQ